MMEPNSVEEFVKQYASEVILTENAKVKFTITGHEVASNIEALQAYRQSRSYTRALAKKFKGSTDFDFGEFAPHIRPDKEDPNKVFCKLTKITLNKDVGEVRKHVKGRRFQHRLHDYKLRKASKGTSDEFDYASMEDESGDDNDHGGSSQPDMEEGDAFEIVPVQMSSAEESEAEGDATGVDEAEEVAAPPTKAKRPSPMPTEKSKSKRRKTRAN